MVVVDLPATAATELELHPKKASASSGPVMIGGSPLGGGSVDPTPKPVSRKMMRRLNRPVKGRLE